MSNFETQDIPGDYGLPIRTNITRTPAAWNTPPIDLGQQIEEFRQAVIRLLNPKRQPIVKVRRNDVSIDGTLTVKYWKWECRICKQTWWSLRWWTTQNSANHHAHNHDDDGPTAKGLFQSVDFARNSYAYQYDPKIMPKKTWIDHMIDAFKPQPKRNPYMTIRRRSTYGGNLGTRHTWWVYCKKCPRSGLIKAVPISLTSTWQEAITTATRHTRNHH